MASALTVRGVAGYRFAALGLMLVALSACGGATTEPITATAFSKIGGVETWDLTGEPSDVAFGIEDDSSAGIYETDEARAVRIVLPGRTVEMQAVLVTFYNGGNNFTFGVRTAELKPSPLTAAFRDVLGQLDVDDTLADRFAKQVAAAPEDQPESVEVGTGIDKSVVLGEWTVGAAVNLTPLAGAGRLVFTGAWPPI